MMMLLDTHAFLWQRSEPDLLSKKAVAALLEEENELWVSAVTVWEVGILAGLSRIRLQTTIRKLVEHSFRDAGIQILPVAPGHVEALLALPFFHQDPFDRMIIAQARASGAAVISRDIAFDRYGTKRVW